MNHLKLIFSRMFIVGFCILVELIWVVISILKLSSYSVVITSLFKVLSIIAVLWIVQRRDNPAYKIPWIIAILTFPLLGGLLYLAMGAKRPAKHISDRLENVYRDTNYLLQQDEAIIDELKASNQHIAGQACYLADIAGFPIYKDTQVDYYPLGDLAFPAMMEELEKAQHFIFLEYFIIEDGRMWGSMLDLLEKKAKEGLDVRLIYDDVGCLNTLPPHYYREVEKRGIRCFAFNPFIPILSTALNNRDHRKILVIDGHTAFSGGINLADEYINEKVKYGHWKDNGIRLEGEAVWNFTLMFLQMWNAQIPTDKDYQQYMPHVYHPQPFQSDGYVQPYGDSPLDSQDTGENVYLNIINNAKRYVYIFTPYLVTDNEMVTALCLAARRRVDVRIVTPGIPDKKLVFWMTQSYYGRLIEAGVRIFEYTPGFLHAKCFVCDDEVATVGTINVDFRSLYLHFECGVYMYQSSVVAQVKKDIDETVQVSQEITKEDKTGLLKSICLSVLRVFAPLM